MLKPGTEGLSSEELRSVLKFPGKNEILLEGVKALLESLNQFDGETLSMSNKIYICPGRFRSEERIFCNVGGGF
ncbi:unnamed protein product [Allacma fusca]|uniref:Uncharacterized protein n=1 Tax=Allacma fusca TaxID=39272 RepID=A0A8J2Q3S8_9HEXA|nr:unnamed protein product [Allacma fusca]